MQRRWSFWRVWMRRGRPLRNSGCPFSLREPQDRVRPNGRAAALPPHPSFRRKPESRESQMKQPCRYIDVRGWDDGGLAGGNATMLVNRRS